MLLVVRPGSVGLLGLQAPPPTPAGAPSPGPAAKLRAVLCLQATVRRPAAPSSAEGSLGVLEPCSLEAPGMMLPAPSSSRGRTPRGGWVTPISVFTRPRSLGVCCSPWLYEAVIVSGPPSIQDDLISRPSP